MYQTRLKKLLPLIWFQLIWLALLLMVARFAMFCSFVEPAQVADKGGRSVAHVGHGLALRPANRRDDGRAFPGVGAGARRLE